MGSSIMRPNDQSDNKPMYTLPKRASKWLHRCLRTIGKVIAAAVLVTTASVAHAHKLNLFTYVEGDKVFVDGYFADGTKARNSSVTVRNGAREIVIEGTTDEEGQFNFKLATPSDLHIVLNAGLGHQAEAVIAATEFGGAASPAAAAAVTTPTTAAPHATATAETEAVATALDARELETTIQRAVSEGVRPLAKEIMDLREKAKVSDMIGGVGFIVGAFGLWALFTSRRNTRNDPPT